VSRRIIQQLPPNLVNRIAAGEVIERPASVVKELVENSIDAGATRVVAEIEDGGRELIRVIDDGCGIPPEELRLAFASHATSKLTSDEDLFAIATMGFRGEALASIGSVSQARVLSRTAANDAGYEIFNRGGEISDPQAAAANVGTTIEVRHLFFNVPARRKFLKGSQTEFGHISEQLLRTALPHPQVSFKLLHNGRVVTDLPATTNEERWLAAWPDEFREQRLPMDVRDAELRLSGLVGLPELARPTGKYQHVYLNGRPIRDKFIQHALREAYRGLTEPGRYPAAILLLTIPPQDVDVNVHPTKVEVRFRDSGRIHGLVLASVRERLLGSDLTPKATPRTSDPVDEAQRQNMQQRLADFFKSAVPGNNRPPSPHRGEERAAWELNPAPHAQRSFDHLAAGLAPRETLPADVAFQTGQAPPLHEDAGTSGSSDASIRSSPPPSPQPLTSHEYVGTPFQGEGVNANTAPPKSAIQLHNSYLVAQSDDGMIIIDQHALHERIMYEELLARVQRGTLESQRLLIPETVQASSRQMAMLDTIQPLLQRLGIEVVPFGPNSVAVNSFPSFLEKLEPGKFVRELLERGEQELLDLHDEEMLHEVLDMMACKAAVKAGDPLTPAEIEALLARRELVERSSNCPHGRPTTLRLSLRDLEKQFKRTGF
jgi:DNA mismatch repair protein MutL